MHARLFGTLEYLVHTSKDIARFKSSIYRQVGKFVQVSILKKKVVDSDKSLKKENNMV